MITIDKRLFSPFKWLEDTQLKRLLPGLEASTPPDEFNLQNQAAHPLKIAFQGLQRRVARPRNEMASLYDSHQIEEELRKSGALASSCALVGICEDGLPIILDFTNPAPGSLLIAGDPGSGKRQLIDSVLASVSRLSQPGQVQITVISQETEEIQVGVGKENQENYALDTRSLAQMIRSYAEEIEQRKSKILDDQIQLFVINDLLRLVAMMDTEILSLFNKIIKHGPRYRLWTIAGLNSCDIPALEQRIVEAFRTHFICGMQDKRLAHGLSGNRRLNTHNLNFGSQFFVPFGDQWLRSWICQPSIEKEMEVG